MTSGPEDEEIDPDAPVGEELIDELTQQAEVELEAGGGDQEVQALVEAPNVKFEPELGAGEGDPEVLPDHPDLDETL